ncbi:hypothetical protein H0H87_007024 [Tephrocybe sp. NHM501043]|nr:hypothetical protein H0H87_007024 [Tephrocybe sp. NHM501043]
MHGPPSDLVDYENAVQFISTNQDALLESLPRDIKEGSAYVLTRSEGSRLVDNLKWLKEKQRHNEHGSTRTISFSDNDGGLGRISWNNIRIGNKAYHVKAYVKLEELLDRLK